MSLRLAVEGVFIAGEVTLSRGVDSGIAFPVTFESLILC